MKHKLLINNNFTFLWFGKFISQIGDKFYSLALAWWILTATNSPAVMGLFLFVSVLPGLLLGLFAGALVDRISKKNLLIITDLLRGLLVLMLVLLSIFKMLTVWQVFVVGASLSLVTAFFDPAAQAILVQLVDRADLSRANSMNQTVNGVCTILGPVLGAGAISLFGVMPVFLFNAISYFVSAVFTVLVKPDVQKDNIQKSESMLQSVKDGVAFLKSSKELLRTISIIASVHFLMGGLLVLMPFLANTLNGPGVHNLGSLEACLGLGLLSAALFISRRKSFPLKEITLLITVLAIGCSFLGISALQFASNHSLIPYLLVFLLLGATISTASVLWQSMIQSKSPEGMIGRIFSVSILAGNISLPLAYGICGFVLNYLPLKILVLICGCALLLLSLLLLSGRKAGLTEASLS